MTGKEQEPNVTAVWILYVCPEAPHLEDDAGKEDKTLDSTRLTPYYYPLAGGRSSNGKTVDSGDSPL